jgi:hypothetical protein
MNALGLFILYCALRKKEAPNYSMVQINGGDSTVTTRAYRPGEGMQGPYSVYRWRNAS